ncbi:phospholipase D family protein [Clostridiisalibacter paucivorans]|uniref:phospholipase D family protein n=1 Tax=Clostridiisalibacter paucivorans TaxID=408753 RepID=UPI0006870260|nr:phospholipase D family protein [Clostridiisalibacter paucivorans]
MTLIKLKDKRTKPKKRSIFKKILPLTLILILLIFINSLLIPLPDGLAFESKAYNISDIDFLYDLTYENNNETIYEQNILDSQLKLIRQAKEFIIIDMFLFNDLKQSRYDFPNISEKLTNTLIKQKNNNPNINILFITDEINNFYGSYESKFLKKLKENDINVIITDSKKLRDSNPVYTSFWRAFIQWFGVKGQGWIDNAFSPNGDDVTLRSYMKLLNFKANHRKVLITENGAIISSANIHDASGYHSNIAFKVRGQILKDLINSELSIAKFSENEFDESNYNYSDKNDDPKPSNIKAKIITEGKIRENLISEIKNTNLNDKITMGMFYLSHRGIIQELIDASNRGVNIKLILDPNKDAFGFEKNGIPNRQVAEELIDKSNNKIDIRWYDTSGEQYHAKITLIEKENETVIIGGSANLTRRNIDNYNLESNIMISANPKDKIVFQISRYFNRIWNNIDGHFTVKYKNYREENMFKYLLYRFQEWSGMGTF